MALDLGKQYGPLPLGAWIVVVGGGLGIAYWGYRQQAPPIEAVDTSGDPGVGDGSIGGWVPTAPGVGPSNGVGGKPTTNDEWARQVIDGMIARNYPAATVDSAVRKYVSGSGTLSITEQAIITVALTYYGSPPQPLPPREDAPPVTPPPTTPVNSTPPTNLQPVAVARFQIGFRWSAPATAPRKIIGYRFYVNNKIWYFKYIVPGSPASIYPLRNNTQYSVQIAAIYSDWSESPRSSPIIVRTAP